MGGLSKGRTSRPSPSYPGHIYFFFLPFGIFRYMLNRCGFSGRKLKPSS